MGGDPLLSDRMALGMALPVGVTEGSNFVRLAPGIAETISGRRGKLNIDSIVLTSNYGYSSMMMEAVAKDSIHWQVGAALNRADSTGANHLCFPTFAHGLSTGCLGRDGMARAILENVVGWFRGEGLRSDIRNIYFVDPLLEEANAFRAAANLMQLKPIKTTIIVPKAPPKAARQAKAPPAAGGLTTPRRTVKASSLPPVAQTKVGNQFDTLGSTGEEEQAGQQPGPSAAARSSSREAGGFAWGRAE